MQSNEKYYGERFETPLITIISLVIVLAMAGAWSLMTSKVGECHAMEYTYCGESILEDHH